MCALVGVVTSACRIGHASASADGQFFMVFEVSFVRRTSSGVGSFVCGFMYGVGLTRAAGEWMRGMIVFPPHFGPAILTSEHPQSVPSMDPSEVNV